MRTRSASEPTRTRPIERGHWSITDPVDIERLHNRDPELLRELVEELSPRIWVAIRPYARDEDHARDLLQDSWLTILKRLDQFKWNGSFSRWAITLSQNVCVDSLRAEEQNQAAEVPLLSTMELVAEGHDPLDEVRRDQARPIVYAALNRLTDRERDTLTVWAIMGRSLTETAEAVGISQSATRSILARAMSKLRRIPEMRALLMDWMAEG